ncbi:hypothetical protein [Candidatus Odyssella thessalonicensis]|uniref:hypothetical protein n=1 Tax=Candidatus Odyssella thessalonicensis TaxID=84647 RepID=UPI00111218D7|nr:hypothetical protein [Candidatus Odyssella thessalonicensis]
MKSIINGVHLFIYRYQILGVLFLLQLAIFWPGIAVPDSQAQYAQALTGNYDDHHPAMMAFIWHHLHPVMPGFGSMYLIQISFLYGGLFFILRTTELFINFKERPWLLYLLFLLPWWPQILVYTSCVLKDSHFTFSFLTVASTLAYYTIHKQPLSLFYAFLLIVALIYGTAVKYQAQFCLPVITLWLGFLVARNCNFITRLATGSLITLAVYSSIHSINIFLTPKTQQSNAWQYVKLYDLAAISLETGKDLIPDFNKTPYYSAEQLKSRFKPNLVDPYIYGDQPLFQKGATEQQRKELWSVWFNTIKEHPFLYLKYRLTNLSYCFTAIPGYSQLDAILSRFLPPHTPLYARVKSMVETLGYIFLSQLLVSGLGVLYLFLGLIYWRRSQLARILLGFTLPAFLLVAILAVLSMAGIPRYTFFSSVMIHASHLFAIGLIAEIKGRRNNCGL